MPFAEAGEARVCYELAGEGPRLLFISGSGGGMWPTPELAAAVQERFTAVALDRRGLGETVAPEGAWTMAEYADDAAAVLDAIGWERCRVLGVSFGGMVAQELADGRSALLGDHFSAADILLTTCLDWALFYGLDLAPVLRSYLDGIHQRPAFATAMKINFSIQPDGSPAAQP